MIQIWRLQSLKQNRNLCPNWNHKSSLKWLSTALKQLQMLTRSGIINHQQIPLVLNVQHQYGVVTHQKYCCHIMQSTELAENNFACCNLLKEFWRGNFYPHGHYNWSSIKQAINIIPAYNTTEIQCELFQGLKSLNIQADLGMVLKTF